jgi:hypothetical protein
MKYELADVFRPERIDDEENIVCTQARNRPTALLQGGMMAG